jgi:hypothetical protein
MSGRVSSAKQHRLRAQSNRRDQRGGDTVVAAVRSAEGETTYVRLVHLSVANTSDRLHAGPPGAETRNSPNDRKMASSSFGRSGLDLRKRSRTVGV